MSRSFGVRSFTTSPPIDRRPSVMSSSPAIMRSAVDFPQPEGPTRIMNSPSAMSRLMLRTASVPSGYRLVTSSSSISAIAVLLAGGCGSSLYGTGGQAGHDSVLEDQHQDDQRHRHHHGRGADRPDRDLEL